MRLILFLTIFLAGTACKENISLDIVQRGICEGENCSLYRAPAFALSMNTDGTYTKDTNPIVRWEPGALDSYASYRLRIAWDATCRTTVRELTLREQEIGLGLLDEGNYFLCLDGITRNELVLPAENSGLRLVVDRTPPQLVAASRLYLNASRTPDVSIEDPNLADCQWSSSPAGLYIAQSSDPLTPIWGGSDGVYPLSLACRDRAGNSAQLAIEVVWDTQAPSVSPMSPVVTYSPLRLAPSVTEPDALYQWSLVSSPQNGDLTFDDPKQLQPEIRASTVGTYQLRLEARDLAGNSSEQELTVMWQAVPELLVNAGQDISIRQTTTLQATVANATSLQWTQLSGPGLITFSSINTEDPNISASVDGNYVLQLSASDGTRTLTDTVNVVWDTAPPTVNAGADQSARSTLALDGSSSGAISFAWTRVSGPGSIGFSAPNAEDTQVNASVDGVYVLRLTATDAAGNTATDDMQLTWDTTAPTVSAGPDRSAAALITLDGSAPGASTYSWSQASGPGTLTFGSTNAEDTTVTASVDGTYTIRLSVTDALGNSANDTMTLTWDTTAPAVNAGADRSASASITLDGSAPGATTFAWTQVSGPGTLTFGSASTEDTTVSATLDGSYVVRLTASDALGNSANDTMTLTWDTTAPTVNAGPDILSNSLYSLNASSSGASTYAWTQVSGPGTISFGSASSEDTTVSASTDGTYVLRLTATDGVGLSASDDIQFVWDTTAPTVNVGSDLLLNAGTTLNATSSGATTYAWTQRSGPGTVSFGSSTSEDSTVSASVDGTYILRLTATDSAGNSAFDELTLTWDTTAPTASMSGQPTGTSSNSTLNISISGTGVSHYRYAIITGSAVCSSATYSSNVLVSTAITDNISALSAGTVTVCVRGLDSVGNIQAAAAATSASWTRTVGGTTATVPTGLSVTQGDTALSLTWTKDVSQSGFLVLRKATAVSETPTDGSSYTLGQSIGSATVVYVGSSSQFANASLTNGTTYHYAVFAHDSSNRYTSGTAISGAPFDCQGPGGGPTAPAFITATPGKAGLYLNWGVGGSGTTGYLVLRRLGSAVCDVPVSGSSYTAGQALGSSTVAYKGTLEGVHDTGLTNGQLYHYRVFAYNSSNQYSTGLATSAVPRDFNLAASFTNAGYNATSGQGTQFIMAEKGVAYLAAEDRGVKTFDVSTPLAPQAIFPAYTSNNMGAGGATYFLDKKGSYLYASDFNEGIRIIDATSPKTALPVVGSLALPAMTGLLVDGNYAYMTSEEVQGTGQNAKRVGGLRIINVANPASPSLVSTLQTDGAVGLEVQKLGSYVYVSYRTLSTNPASTWHGIKVYNVSNPASPSEVAAIPLQSVEGLRIFGTYLIATVANVSGGHDGIHIYSLANPASPALLGSATIGETSELIDVTVLGEYAFATSFNSKMIEVFDISNKASPSSTTNLSTGTYFPLYINNDGQRILHSIQYGGFDLTTVFTEETVPMPPDAMDLTRASGSATFTWRSGGGSTTSYIVLRSATPITTAPTNGVTYTVGQTLGSATVVASGSATSYTEASIPSGLGYYIAVYAVDGSLVYSSAPARAFAY